VIQKVSHNLARIKEESTFDKKSVFKRVQYNNWNLSKKAVLASMACVKPKSSSWVA
jgi:hypothetical protein